MSVVGTSPCREIRHPKTLPGTSPGATGVVNYWRKVTERQSDKDGSLVWRRSGWRFMGQGCANWMHLMNGETVSAGGKNFLAYCRCTLSKWDWLREKGTCNMSFRLRLFEGRSFLQSDRHLRLSCSCRLAHKRVVKMVKSLIEEFPAAIWGGNCGKTCVASGCVTCVAIWWVMWSDTCWSGEYEDQMSSFSGYEGRYCEKEQKSICNTLRPCGENGDCELTTSLNDFICHCKKGFIGRSLFDFLDYHPCLSIPRCLKPKQGIMCLDGCL